MTHVVYSLDLRLGDEIADGLHSTVCVVHGDAGPPPGFAAEHVGLPTARRGTLRMDFDGAFWLDCNRPDRGWIFEEEPGLEVLRHDVTGDADRNWPAVGGKRLFDVANRIGEEKAHTVGFRFAGAQRKRGGRIPLAD